MADRKMQRRVIFTLLNWGWEAKQISAATNYRGRVYREIVAAFDGVVDPNGYSKSWQFFANCWGVADNKLGDNEQKIYSALYHLLEWGKYRKFFKRVTRKLKRRPSINRFLQEISNGITVMERDREFDAVDSWIKEEKELLARNK